MSAAKGGPRTETWHRHYTDHERQILVQLVLERISLIEKRQNDSYTLELKQEAWDEIVAHFNAEPACTQQRDRRQLKKLWDNVKTRAKRMVADRRLQLAIREQELKSTGLLVMSSTDSIEEFADLDTIVNDTIAEKVIYYMNQRQHNQSEQNTVLYDEEDDVEEDDERGPVSFNEQDGDLEYVQIQDMTAHVQEEDVKMYVIDALNSSQRQGISKSTEHSGGDSGPPPKRFVPDTRSNSAQLSLMGRVTDAGHPQFSDNHLQASNPPYSSGGTHLQFTPASTYPLDIRQSNSSHGSSPALTTTSSAATTSTGTGGPRVASSTAPANTTSTGSKTISTGSKKSTTGPKTKQRSLKSLRKLESKLRISKLRMEMKHAISEHEEKMKVMRAQEEVLNSLRPNPSSIMNLLFR